VEAEQRGWTRGLRFHEHPLKNNTKQKQHKTKTTQNKNNTKQKQGCTKQKGPQMRWITDSPTRERDGFPS
jgi:hypothetical protein